MSKRSNYLLIADMLDSAHKILNYTQGMTFDVFMLDEKTKDAVIRNFEIVGEAANHVEMSFKAKHPEVPWNRLRGFRNRIVHDYMGIDYEIVWEIIHADVDQLVRKLSQIKNT